MVRDMVRIILTLTAYGLIGSSVLLFGCSRFDDGGASDPLRLVVRVNDACQKEQHQQLSMLIEPEGRETFEKLIPYSESLVAKIRRGQQTPGTLVKDSGDIKQRKWKALVTSPLGRAGGPGGITLEALSMDVISSTHIVLEPDGGVEFHAIRIGSRWYLRRDYMGFNSPSAKEIMKALDAGCNPGNPIATEE
jgi:hypothetical protein